MHSRGPGRSPVKTSFTVGSQVQWRDRGVWTRDWQRGVITAVPKE